MDTPLEKKKCLHCTKKLRFINEDEDYKGWKRKYHKKCYKMIEEDKRLNDLLIYYNNNLFIESALSNASYS